MSTNKKIPEERSLLGGIYSHFRHVISDDEASPESVKPLREESRKLENILRCLYDIIFKGGYRGYGVPESITKESLRFLETHLGETVPGWAHACLRLGSIVPAIDHLEIVMQSTTDHLILLYLRDAENKHPQTP